MLEIKLDANALMSMFPVGSESYLKLQQAVLTEASRRIIKGVHSDQLTPIVRSVCNQVSGLVKSEMMADYAKVIDGHYSNQVILKPEFIETIKAEIRTRINLVIHDGVKEHTSNMESRVQAYVDVRMGSVIRNAVIIAVEKEIEELRGTIQDRVRSIVSEVIIIKE